MERKEFVVFRHVDFDRAVIEIARVTAVSDDQAINRVQSEIEYDHEKMEPCHEFESYFAIEKSNLEAFKKYMSIESIETVDEKASKDGTRAHELLLAYEDGLPFTVDERVTIARPEDEDGILIIFQDGSVARATTYAASFRVVAS